MLQLHILLFVLHIHLAGLGLLCDHVRVLLVLLLAIFKVFTGATLLTCEGFAVTYKLSVKSTCVHVWAWHALPT